MVSKPKAVKADTTVMDRKRQEVDEESDKQERANKAAMRARLGRGSAANKMKYSGKTETVGG